MHVGKGKRIHGLLRVTVSTGVSIMATNTLVRELRKEFGSITSLKPNIA